MAVKNPRAKRSKVEVEQEFSQLADSFANEKDISSPKMSAAEQMHESDVRAAVSEITVEVISKKLSELSLEISRTFSGLSEKMIGEVDQLRSLKEAVALESKEMKRNHGMDVAATRIDLLLDDYSEKKKTLESEIEMILESWEK